MIRDRFCYYLVVNQLFGVIARFGRDQLLAESVLLQQCRHFLRAQARELSGPALPLVKMLLHDSRLPLKGNLLTRAHDVDELNADLEMAVYTSIPNPLLASQVQRTPVTRRLGYGAA
jgi:siderophore synthetase component